MNLKLIFAKDGVLSKILPNFEPRTIQLKLAEAVQKSLEESSILLAEADTGTGKSLAYLVPSLHFAISTGSPVIVSTYTKNLQEQLLKKDVPLALRLLESDAQVSLAKGRRNYLCLRRFRKNVSLLESLDGREAAYLSTISDWSQSTRTGDVEELNIPIPSDIWEKNSSDGLSCAGTKCPFLNHCFYQNIRRLWHSSALIITNHSLLFTDFNLKKQQKALLPQYSAVILDEAHTIADSVASAFSSKVSEHYIQHLLIQAKTAVSDSLVVGRLVENAKRETKKFFEKVKKEALNLPPSGRVIKPLSADPSSLISSVKKVSERLHSIKDTMIFDVGLEAESFAVKLEEVTSFLDNFIKQESEDSVYYIESKEEDITLCQTPLNIERLFGEEFLSHGNPTILVGATLTAGEYGFNYLTNTLGIKDAQFLKLPPIFNYASSTKIILYPNGPEPTEEGYEEFLVKEIAKLVVENRGSALILFTSYETMRYVYAKTAAKFRSAELNPLIQGEEQRTVLIEKFRSKKNSVLFGTESFWQGVDVPGEALTLLIITRLPFDVPARAEIEAKSERIKAQGRNPFLEFSLPEAVIKLRQGFGRLIRHSTDKGRVAIMDSRILKRPYGKIFLSALPTCPIIHSS
ncbi:MAG: ATP-dependent DNA helicase [Planctomycetota bacterium]|nr:ATP-dependent DNA helicase [Planctomycetota bacterium]